MAALTNLRAVLVVRDFRRLFGVRLAGQFGDGLLQAALATFVLFSPERQPTAASVAGAFAVLFLPYSLVGPFAGVFLDEWRRRQVLVYANFLRAFLVIGVAALVWQKHDGLDLGIAAKYGKSSAQVMVRWSMQLGNIVLPKSVTPERIEQNIDVFDFELDDADMAAMASLETGRRTGPNPDEFNEA